MNRSTRIRVFATGFLGGCLVAAGIAFVRIESGPPKDPLPPLPSWKTIAPPPAPPETPHPSPGVERVVKAWRTPSGDARRWLVRSERGRLWRIEARGDGITVLRADRIAVSGNPGIETPALRAGLAHNGFEVLSFDPGETLFTVAVDPFRPDAIERARRLLLSRDPYILDAEGIGFGAEPDLR